MAWEEIVDILLNCPEPFKKYNLDSTREFCMAAQRGFDQICPDDLLQKLRKQYDGWWFIDKDCKEYDLLEDEEEQEEQKKKKSRMWENAMEEPDAKAVQNPKQPPNIPMLKMIKSSSYLGAALG